MSFIPPVLRNLFDIADVPASSTDSRRERRRITHARDAAERTGRKLERLKMRPPIYARNVRQYPFSVDRSAHKSALARRFFLSAVPR